MARRSIHVGDTVRISFDNPPDEWGVVEQVYRANPNYERRALVRQIDGQARVWPIRQLSVMDEAAVARLQVRLAR